MAVADTQPHLVRSQGVLLQQLNVQLHTAGSKVPRGEVFSRSGNQAQYVQLILCLSDLAGAMVTKLKLKLKLYFKQPPLLECSLGAR